jgi:hypothetical protein
LKRALCSLLLVAAVVSSAGQTPEPSSPAEPHELLDTIAQLDTKIFGAFNAHDADALMAMLTDDLEFYQDNDGLKNYQECSGDFKKMFANTPDIRRNGQDECGVFEFVMLWKQTADTWKISRVVSYGH